MTILEQIDEVFVRSPKRKPGRPRKFKRGGKRIRKEASAMNRCFEESYNDPPLALGEAVADTNVGNCSDEEDPLESNLRCSEFNHGLDSPLKWIYGDCHSPSISGIGTLT